MINFYENTRVDMRTKVKILQVITEVSKGLANVDTEALEWNFKFGSAGGWSVFNRTVLESRLHYLFSNMSKILMCLMIDQNTRIWFLDMISSEKSAVSMSVEDLLLYRQSVTEESLHVDDHADEVLIDFDVYDDAMISEYVDMIRISYHDLRTTDKSMFEAAMSNLSESDMDTIGQIIGNFMYVFRGISYNDVFYKKVGESLSELQKRLDAFEFRMSSENK